MPIIKVMTQNTADDMYDMLIRFYKLCEHLKISFWLMCGTLLGAARNTAILSWDKDVDIGMLEADRIILWNNKQLIDHWKLKERYSDHIYRINYKNVYMDVFSFKMISNKYQEISFVNRWRFNEYFYPTQLFPLKQIRLGPLILPAPNQTGEWLSQTYGKWYIVPKEYRHLPTYRIDASFNFKFKLTQFIPYPRYLVNPTNIIPNKILENKQCRLKYYKIFCIIFVILILIYYYKYGRLIN